MWLLCQPIVEETFGTLPFHLVLQVAGVDATSRQDRADRCAGTAHEAFV